MALHILIVDDESTQQTITTKVLESRLGAEVHSAHNGKVALESLESLGHVDLVLMDVRMPEMDGLTTLETIRETMPALPVIMMTASDDIQDAVRSMQLGANDFIIKPMQPERLITSINNAVKTSQLQQEVSRLKRKTGELSGFEDMIGHDNGLAETVVVASRAATSDIAVMITGESGVGKELMARGVHVASDRAQKPFIAVNCGAIPENLVESVLFGHEKGAFTGATSKKQGKFMEANGGTLFLDEVGELPLETQVKLLRALQQKEIEPVGANHPTQVDVRIVLATNRDLVEEIAAGRFREDLFFRLNGIPVHIPPLRERLQDVDALIQHFIDVSVAKQQGHDVSITDDAVEWLKSQPWKGNIRELENAIFRAIIMDTDGVLNVESFERFAISARSDVHAASNDISSSDAVGLRDANGEFKTLDQLELEIMDAVIDACEGNMTAAARALSINKSTLYRRSESLKATS